MVRATLAALVAALAAASPAAAATPATGLRDDPAAAAVALAGPDVVVLRDLRHRAELVAVPRTGGPARRLLSVPSARGSVDGPALSASAQRVMAILEVDGPAGKPRDWRL